MLKQYGMVFKRLNEALVSSKVKSYNTVKWGLVTLQTSLYSLQGEGTKALSYLSELHVSLSDSGHGTLTVMY